MSTPAPELPEHLKKYQVSVDTALLEQQKIKARQEEREGGGGGDLNWLFVDDGQQKVIRIVPIPGGKLSKEVYKYKSLGDKKFVSPYHHASIEDPFHAYQMLIEGKCKGWRNYTKAKFSQGSDQYKRIEAYTKDLWSKANKLRATVEHYLIVLVYEGQLPPGADGKLQAQDLDNYEGPMVFRQSDEAFGGLLAVFASPWYSNPSPVDFYDGRRLIVARNGKEKDTKYTYTAEPVTSPFPGAPDFPELAACPDLDVIFKPAKTVEMRAYLDQNGYIKLVSNIDRDCLAMIGEVVVPPEIPQESGAGFEFNASVPSGAAPAGALETPKAPESAPAVIPTSIPLVTAAPAAPVIQWNGTPEFIPGANCPSCGQPQYTSPDGPTCSGGHYPLKGIL